MVRTLADDEFDDDQDDREAPSPEDMARFGDDEVAYCPECGKEVWDAAEVCPACHAFLGGNTAVRPPAKGRFHRAWAPILIVLLIIGLIFGCRWLYT